MAANTNPIFVKTPQTGWADLTTGNTNKDGSGTIDMDIFVVFTAGTEGSRVEKINFMPKGNNVQTVARIFINNGGGNNVPANNALIREKTIPQCVISEVQEQAQSEIIFENGLVLPADYRLLVTIGTTVAGGIKVVAEGGDY